MRDPLLPRLLSALQSPPPWLWCADGRLWQRLGPPGAARLPLEVLQQLHWWLIRPVLAPRRTRSQPPLPWSLTCRACWLNSYRPFEVAWWWAAGVRDWRELSRHRSNSLAWAVHARRRLPWPEQCQPALRLLQDKAALLSLAPAPWRAPALPLDLSHLEADPPPPDWWPGALTGPGVVIKPRRGHGGRAVVRFRLAASGLEVRALVGRLPNAAADADALLQDRGVPPPRRLLAHWQRLFPAEDAALAAPCLLHSRTLPATDPAVVVRVITARTSPEAPIAVRLAWLEVPLAEGEVAVLTLEGRGLPRSGAPLSLPRRQALQRWQTLLAAGAPPCVTACLGAAVHLHGLLPPIDQVAWDWIPADPAPLLLEGNGGFGLLVPQLLERLNLAPPRDP